MLRFLEECNRAADQVSTTKRAGDVVTGVCERFHHVPMDGRVTALRLPYLLEQTEYLFQLGMPGDGFDSHTCKQGGLLGLADCLPHP